MSAELKEITLPCSCGIVVVVGMLGIVVAVSIVNVLAHCSVNYNTGHILVVASSDFANKCTYIMRVYDYVLVITVVNLHLVAIFIFSHLCPLFCNYLYQRPET